MKSPWKYLAGLTSFGRTAKEPASQPEAEASNPDEPSLAPEEWIPAPLDPTEDAASTAADAPDMPADPTGNLVVAVEIIEEVSAAPAVDPPHAHDNALERTRSTQPRKAQRHVRKPSARPVAMVEATPLQQLPSAVRPPPTLSEEVAALDEEVRQLRRQLTEKLRLQNTQLETLLKRFDAS